MNRISVTLVWFVLLASMANPVSGTLNLELTDTHVIGKNESEVGFVALSSGDECGDRDNDGVCDEGGMVGLELDCCSDGEIFALVAFVAIFAGIPTYLIFRKLWKIVKKRIYVNREYVDNDENDGFDNHGLGSDLPVTEKEFIEWKQGKGTGRNRHNNRVNVKEELLILSIYLFIVYLFWNNGI